MQHHPDSLRQAKHFCRTLPISLPLSLLLATTLSACGGGGGTTDTAAPPTQVTPPVTAPVATAATPLALTAASAKLAPTLAFGYGATPLAVAQMVVDWTSRVSTSATLPRTCSNGGSQIASYSDTDGNGRVSSGDKLSVTYTRCRVKELDGIIDGTMNIVFTAPSNGQQLAGTISFASGFGDHTEIPHQDLVGSVRFDHASGALSKLLHVYSDTQPFVMSFSDAGITRNETITALDVQHELRIDTARASASMRYHLASDLLVGSLDVSTRTPLGSWFDTFPDAGELLLSGAGGSQASLRVKATDNTSFESMLGDTVVSSVNNLGVEFLWSSGAWLAQNASLDNYNIKLATQNEFKLLVEPDLTSMAPSGALSWIYSRPLNPATISSATFRKGGLAISDVDAKVSYNGAILTVTPLRQLVPGATYSLVFNGSGIGGVRDNAGASLRLQVPQVKIAQSVSAAISTGGSATLLLGPAATLTLDASASSANGAVVSGMRWRQVSGPTLLIDNPTAPRATLSSASPARGVAVIALDASNALGEVDTRQISIDVLSDLSQALVYNWRVGNAEPELDSSARSNYPPTANYYAPGNSLQFLATSAGKTFLIGLPANLRWQTGLTAAYGVGGTAGVEGKANTSCFGAQSGTFKVLDFALDGDGKLARAAIDFDDNCNGVLTQTSIRYRSDVPLRK